MMKIIQIFFSLYMIISNMRITADVTVPAIIIMKTPIVACNMKMLVAHHWID